jgi:hypothetical protein
MSTCNRKANTVVATATSFIIFRIPFDHKLVEWGIYVNQKQHITHKCGESHCYDPQFCARDRVFDEVSGGEKKAHLGAV